MLKKVEQMADILAYILKSDGSKKQKTKTKQLNIKNILITARWSNA